jgi:hypothetical protein
MANVLVCALEFAPVPQHPTAESNEWFRKHFQNDNFSQAYCSIRPISERTCSTSAAKLRSQLQCAEKVAAEQRFRGLTLQQNEAYTLFGDSFWAPICKIHVLQSRLQSPSCYTHCQSTILSRNMTNACHKNISSGASFLNPICQKNAAGIRSETHCVKHMLWNEGYAFHYIRCALQNSRPELQHMSRHPIELGNWAPRVWEHVSKLRCGTPMCQTRRQSTSLISNTWELYRLAGVSSSVLNSSCKSTISNCNVLNNKFKSMAMNSAVLASCREVTIMNCEC